MDDRTDDGRREEREDFVQQSMASGDGGVGGAASSSGGGGGGLSFAPGLADMRLSSAAAAASSYEMDPHSPSMLTLEQFSRRVEGPPRPLLLRVLRRLMAAAVFGIVFLLGLFCVCAPVVCCALVLLCLCLAPLALATFGITWMAQN